MKILKVCFVFIMVALPSFWSRSCTAVRDDEEANWGRAFNGAVKPEFVTVIHSRYRRLPALLYEGYYYFELTLPPEYLAAWISEQRLVPANPQLDISVIDREAPRWFLPKPLEYYEMWKPSNEAWSNFRILRDKASGHLFVKDSQ